MYSPKVYPRNASSFLNHNSKGRDCNHLGSLETPQPQRPLLPNLYRENNVNQFQNDSYRQQSPFIDQKPILEAKKNEENILRTMIQQRMNFAKEQQMKNNYDFQLKLKQAEERQLTLKHNLKIRELKRSTFLVLL